MRRLRHLRRLALLLALLLAPAGLAEEEPWADPGPDPESDASTPAYRAALELQRKGRWASAKKAFERLLRKYPDSVHAEDAEVRSGDNAFLGCTVVHRSGPPERRIDISVMGDGFTIDARDQALQAKWARLCLDVLWSEPVFDEYRTYFNVYFVRLASLEEGVDPNLSPEQRAKIEERNRKRHRKKKVDFDTALDCKAAGPQGQVMSNRALVFKWLKIAERDEAGCGDDEQVIAFARFGKLGMAGGGVANVGRPDKSITVHEFGHSFVGLADEYAINPEPPRWRIRAANASMTDDPKQVPWAHFLAKRVKGVGIFEGGATYQKGVWRPAASCAMNSAGATGYCPVCREQAVLSVYRHVNPVDESTPGPGKVVRLKAGAEDVLAVLPMRPRRRALEVRWFVQPVALTESEGWRDEPDTKPELGGRGWSFPGWGDEMGVGRRGREKRSRYDDPPPGTESKLGKVERGKRRAASRHVFPVGRLEPGTYLVIAEVRDPTPWVLKDSRHLLEERVVWRVTISPADG